MAVTIPGGGHSVITFTVSGSASGNYATDFANAVATDSVVTALPAESDQEGALGVFNSGSTGLVTDITIPYQYLYIASGAASTITLSASNETMLAGSLVSVVESGNVGGERVTFTGGDNSFTGSTTGVGEDTITSGSGHDTIFTGDGSSTVFTEGYASVTLNDTSAGAGDIAVMQAGSSTVFAYGVADTVFAGASGSVVGGSSQFLLTTGGTPVSVTVDGGTGGALMYGSNGTDVTFNNASGSAEGIFVAGGGNETLNGAGAAGGFVFYGGTDTAGVESVTGGSGYDYFTTGTGTEDFTAGLGGAQFDISSLAGGVITINDFGSGDSVHFDSSYTTATTGGNLTVTLGNGTTIEFVGITSLSGHLN